MLSYLRLPSDVAMAENQRRNSPQSQNYPACHEEIRLAGRDSAPPKVADAAARADRCNFQFNRFTAAKLINYWHSAVKRVVFFHIPVLSLLSDDNRAGAACRRPAGNTG